MVGDAEKTFDKQCAEFKVRQFESGALRDNNTDKWDWDEALHPLVERSYAEFMHKNTYLSDGTRRPANNWQKGIPKDEYMKSQYRHFQDVWAMHHGIKVSDNHGPCNILDLLNALKFNINGYIYELLREQDKPKE